MNCPRALFFGICACLLGAAALNQAQAPNDSEEWKDEIAKGYLPYHQLTIDDFPVNDHDHPEAPMWVQSFIRYTYRSAGRFNGNWFYVSVAAWNVHSGFDKNLSSRKSSYHPTKSDLAFEQAYLDISELHARKLGSIQPGELPTGGGSSETAAIKDLDDKLKVLFARTMADVKGEVEQFAAATKQGRAKKKLIEQTKLLQERLKAAGIKTQ